MNERTMTFLVKKLKKQYADAEASRIAVIKNSRDKEAARLADILTGQSELTAELLSILGEHDITYGASDNDHQGVELRILPRYYAKRRIFTKNAWRNPCTTFCCRSAASENADNTRGYDLYAIDIGGERRNMTGLSYGDALLTLLEASIQCSEYLPLTSV
jgi:hypothetical protein